MDKEAGITALEVVNDYPEDRLAKVFYEFGELRNSRALAREIAHARKTNKIETSFQLREILSKYLPRWGGKSCCLGSNVSPGSYPGGSGYSSSSISWI